MGEEFGNKETKEALIGVIALSALLAKKFKDGVQFKDFTEMYSEIKDDPEFVAKMKEAYEGIGAVPDEVRDFDLEETFDLLIDILPEIKNLVGAFK